MYYGFIFITINIINGMMYVGKRTCRKGDNYYYGSGKYFKRAFKKYGKENFIRIVVDYAYDKKELNEKEKFYIKDLNAVEDKMFYNLADGGEGGNIPFIETNKKSIMLFPDKKIFKSISDCARYLNCKVSSVSYAVRHNHLLFEKYELWFVDDLNNYKPQEYFEEQKKEKQKYRGETSKRKVILFPNEIIFDSLTDCAKYLSIPIGSIGSALNKKTTCHGYDIWYYDDLNNYTTPEVRKKQRKPRKGNKQKKVIRIEDGMIFNSAKEASLYLGLTKGAVSNGINRKEKIGGFEFCYLNEYDKYVPLENKQKKKIIRQSLYKKVIDLTTGIEYESALACDRANGWPDGKTSKVCNPNTPNKTYHGHKLTYK